MWKRCSLLLVMATSCASTRTKSGPLGPAATVRVDPQIVTPEEGASRRELMLRADRALREGRWQEAIDPLQTLRAAGRITEDTDMPVILFNLGLAYEGQGDKERARDVYHEEAQRFPASREARAALLRAIAIHADLEEWGPLGETADALLGRKDLDPVDHMTAIGGRALSAIERGDDVAAMRDVQNGLDEVEALGFGATGRLPLPAAQLRFALAEVRRVRSERIAFVPLTSDFLVKIEGRCQGLLDAQHAYADAMRSEDPHWAAMSGYRIGAMYRTLHHDLVQIPPTDQAKTDKQKQLFFAMMHMRYRVLLEKGLEMMKRTSAFASKNPDVVPWAQRADAARSDMEQALADEKTLFATFPYTEEEVQKALSILEKKVLARGAAQQ